MINHGPECLVCKTKATHTLRDYGKKPYTLGPSEHISAIRMEFYCENHLDFGINKDRFQNIEKI